jgi:hypothetical protein
VSKHMTQSIPSAVSVNHRCPSCTEGSGRETKPSGAWPALCTERLGPRDETLACLARVIVGGWNQTREAMNLTP